VRININDRVGGEVKMRGERCRYIKLCVCVTLSIRENTRTHQTRTEDGNTYTS